MLDFSLDKIVVIVVIAVLVLGPAKVPEYAAKLARFVRSFRGFVDSAQSRMRDELGPEYSEIDWKKLDPRQYDPRQIIKDSLLAEPTTHHTPESPPVRVPNPFHDLVPDEGGTTAQAADPVAAKTTTSG